MDETFRVTFGYAYLRTGDARLSRGQNPPLADLLLVAPLLVRDDIALPLSEPAWAEADVFGFSDEFLWQANADKAHALIMLARLPAMGLALLLAALIHSGARRLAGARAGTLALLLTVFDPNLIAHGRIAGNDLPLAAFSLGAALAFDRALAADSRRQAALAGLFCGAALASKYTALWLGPILFGIAALHPTQITLARRLTHWLIVGAISLSVIWATFGFQTGSIAPGGLPVPAPDYWISIGGVQQRVASSTPAFLNGRISVDGFLEYFPITFAVKTPLPTLILFLTGAAALIRQRVRRSVALWLPFVVFFGAAIIGRLDLGYRLILPALPFALIIAAASVAWLRSRLASAIGAVTIVWLAISTLAIFPNHLIFFNELAGGSANGYRLLVDSNYDWGQDLIALRDWMARHQVDHLSLAYFGSAPPKAYGLQADLLPGFNRNDFGPEVEGYSAHAAPPGWHAISATTLQLGLLFTHWDAYAAFRDRAPDDRVGSILLYHVPDAGAAPARAVVLGPAAIDLDRATLGGQSDSRLIVKWAGRDAAMLDMQGPARYITRGGETIVGFAPDVHDALIARAERLVGDESGELRLFEIDARVALDRQLAALGQAPIAAPEGTPLNLPIEFDGGLALLGYDLSVESGQPIDLVTYWQARRTPSAQLAVFAHVLDAEGQLLAQGDGLNVRLSALEPGDVILQHFVIDRPANAAWLDIGLYHPADNSRLTVRLPDSRAIDRVRVRLSR